MVRLIVSFFLVRHVYLEHVLGIGFFMPRNLIVASPIAFEPSMAPSITMKNAVVPPLIVAWPKADWPRLGTKSPPWFVAPPELAPPTDAPRSLLCKVRRRQRQVLRFG